MKRKAGSRVILLRSNNIEDWPQTTKSHRTGMSHILPYSLQEESNWLTPWSWTSRLLRSSLRPLSGSGLLWCNWDNGFLFLKPPVCGTLLGQPWQTKKNMSFNKYTSPVKKMVSSPLDRRGKQGSEKWLMRSYSEVGLEPKPMSHPSPLHPMTLAVISLGFVWVSLGNLGKGQIISSWKHYFLSTFS